MRTPRRFLHCLCVRSRSKALERENAERRARFSLTTRPERKPLRLQTDFYCYSLKVQWRGSQTIGRQAESALLSYQWRPPSPVHCEMQRSPVRERLGAGTWRRLCAHDRRQTRREP